MKSSHCSAAQLSDLSAHHTPPTALVWFLQREAVSYMTHPTGSPGLSRTEPSALPDAEFTGQGEEQDEGGGTGITGARAPSLFVNVF